LALRSSSHSGTLYLRLHAPPLLDESGLSSSGSPLPTMTKSPNFAQGGLRERERYFRNELDPQVTGHLAAFFHMTLQVEEQ
jgi:hypothetical protein